MTPKFFRPNNSFVNWIIEQANDRIIFDIGFGSGHVLEKIFEAGYTKLVGCDPYTDVMQINMDWMMKHGTDKPHFLPYEIDSDICKRMLGMGGDKIVAILCRPCHHPDLVYSSYKICKEAGVELYYIGLRNNVKRDLDEWDIPYTEVQHKGSSAENEIVLKLV